MIKNGNDFKKLTTLMKEMKVAMLTVKLQDGTLESRPMMLQEVADGGELLFFVSIDSEKTQNLIDQPQVNLTFASAEKAHYVSVTGEAKIVHDREKTKELWNPLNRAWFNEGIEDPHLAILSVAPSSAEYWDAPYGKAVQFLGMAKAMLTGKQYQAGHGEHVRL